MHNHHHAHRHHHQHQHGKRETLSGNALLARSAPIPDHRIPLLALGGRLDELPSVTEPMDRPLAKRDATTPDTTRLVPRRDATCSPDNNVGRDCGRTLTETPTLAIALGVAIPLVCAFVVFFILHRRHVKKLRKEDEQDKMKALDYGLDEVPAASSGAKMNMPPGPGFPGQGAEKGGPGNHQPGMSMDWTMESPYFLPPGLHKSQESLHSLSRTLPGGDKYGPASTFDTHGSMRSSPTGRRGGNMDDNSSYTAGSSRNVGGQSHALGGDDMSQNLLGNAQRMSTSPPLAAPQPPNSPPAAHLQSDNRFDELGLPPSNSQSQLGGTENKEPALRNSHNYLGAFIHSGGSQSPDLQQQQQEQNHQQEREHVDHVAAPGVAYSTNDAPKLDFDLGLSNQTTTDLSEQRRHVDTDSDYGDDSSHNHHSNNQPTPGLPQFSIMPAEEPKALPDHHPQDGDGHGQYDHEHAEGEDGTDSIHDVYDQYYDSNHLIDTRRLTMGIRPLPPEDPSDNPEQRANRIRSFYKEYFDDSKPFQQEYVDDYGAEVPPLPNPPPFAQPLPRRAMTPPPRMPGASAGGFPPRRHPGAGHRPPPGMNMGFGHSATNSLSSAPTHMGGPRAFSSASGRMPQPRQKKPLPPPSPLHVLPTPHKLKDDMFLPIDFAPAHRAKDRQAGRPETPLGGLQHYNLMVPSHSPLVSSFDELPAVPSPHALRKSGTYTALDFAPPPRFKNEGSTAGSDAGSIRSHHTGISAMQAQNIRTGAYRVSRLPAETVGTRDDFSSNLKPQWDMRK
ncbi:uncharacterized protein GIQ15_01535 [Arthroderma uncinatum]|uniref:uncharacterized protein n=1 Tax=Arthroderma uncinatum TaxID=74035 RepID=UPI00144AEA8B|nr:uncharacterized protein GIQ15_01535 [Arthroderma uncinatum]KAF3492018.1 hypothetical protein GIQ15_01535 [Arthroderma uncinatum]